MKFLLKRFQTVWRKWRQRLLISSSLQRCYISCRYIFNDFFYRCSLSVKQLKILTNGTKLGVCSQNVSCQPCGAYTGEVSAAQLKDAGILCTIIGHSERRQSEKIQTFESNKLIASKIKYALDEGLSVCVCIGETDNERKEGKTFLVLEEQIKAIKDSVSDWSRFSLAYEPLWAIGTGNTASAEQAQDVHAHVRSFMEKTVGADVAKSLRICYGGSVKPKNSEELIRQKDIDGYSFI